MDALIKTVSELFTAMHRYTVPPYQRHYVWTEEQQWQPLWEDVERVADARLDDAEDHHFLGAIVIRREKTPPGGITEWSVIDGQQRLTTLQLLIAAMGRAALEDGFDAEARKLSKLVQHDEEDAEGDDRFKFWPTLVNRDAFREVVSPDGLPEHFEDDPNNSIHEAWKFFHHASRQYAHAEAAEGEEVSLRYAALREAVTGLLQLVTISLEKEDPAQVIFETLNARGTRLLALDLVKNAVFEAAEKQGHSLDQVHTEHWNELSDRYWSKEVRLGRITAPRSEIFLQHWLAMMLGEVVPFDRLFELFRNGVLRGRDGDDAVALIRTLNSDARLLRSFSEFAPGTFEHRFFDALDRLDTTTMHPLALLLFRSRLEPERLARTLAALESYLVRRMVCGLTTKAYNRLGATLVAAVRTDSGRADELVVDELLASQSDTARWPTDDEVLQHLTSQGLYDWLARKRVVMILSALELDRRQGKAEPILELPRKLQVEHVMPQSWRRHWSLPEDAGEEEEKARDARINLLGNLTLVTGALNGSMSNGPWDAKREALEQHSLLLLNRDLLAHEGPWNERAIDDRTARLGGRLTKIWPGPHVFMPEGWKPRDAESWPEFAMDDPAHVSAVYKSGTAYLRALIADLAGHVGERRTFRQVEESVDWPPGRLAGVCGGFASKTGKEYAGRRPWRLHLDEDGAWWMWMDERQAAAVGGNG